MNFKGRVIVDHPNLILEAMQGLAQDRGFKFGSNPKNFENHSEWDLVDCELAIPEKKGLWASFQLQQMPGCCAVLIVSYVRTYPRTQDTFDTILKIIEQAAYDAGFGSVAMTQVVPKFSQMFWKDELWFKCLDRGWHHSPAFINAKSGNPVIYLTKDMKQKGKVEGLEIKQLVKVSTQEGSSVTD